MELQKFLIEALQKRFSANATVKAIEKQITEIAEQTTFKKYKDNILFADGLEFELGGVKARLSHWRDDLTLDKVELRLAYFCTSKLPKAKKERLQEVKYKYKEEKYMEGNNYKVAIWRELGYTIDIETVLSGNFNLEIRV
jgi:hypothetical protein